MSALGVEHLTANHGLLVAVREVSLELERGDILALVGANGAGKTTLLRAIAGAHKIARGRILLDGHDVTALGANRRARRGIALVPEGRRLFGSMTVDENLRLAAQTKRAGRWTYRTVLDAFPMLEPLAKRRCSELSGGQQQAAAIARALMTNPDVLLIDECSLGLSPVAVNAVYESLQAVIGAGASIVLVEQDLGRAMRVATHVACMLEGSIVLRGRTPELTKELVTQAYFGLRSRAGLEIEA